MKNLGLIFLIVVVNLIVLVALGYALAFGACFLGVFLSDNGFRDAGCLMGAITGVLVELAALVFAIKLSIKIYKRVTNQNATNQNAS